MALTIGNTGPQGSATLPAAPAAAAAATAATTRASVAVPAPAPQPAPAEQVQKAVEALQQLVEVKAPNSLAFSVDASTGKIIVRITDAKTGEMIRQIPPEEMLDIARSLDRMQGMLLQQQA